MVKYVWMDGEQISKEWYSLLSDIRTKDRVSFHINEGHRTMARQWYFWNLYRSGRGNLAAFPTPFAPHIRTGRFDHAIDFNNAAGVARAAARRGVTLRWTVRGESWHLEADRAELAHYYSKHNLPRTLELGNKGRAVLKLKKLMRARGLQDFPRGRKFDVNTRAAIKRFQARHNLKADGIVGPTTWRVLHG